MELGRPTRINLPNRFLAAGLALDHIEKKYTLKVGQQLQKICIGYSGLWEVASKVMWRNSYWIFIKSIELNQAKYSPC